MNLPDRGAAGWSLGKDMTVKTVAFQVSRSFGIGYSLHHFVQRSGYLSAVSALDVFGLAAALLDSKARATRSMPKSRVVGQLPLPYSDRA